MSAKPLEFRGRGGEYFGIWIVNLLLCIVTLGIYIPWARVRTRRYFHRNTFLDGHSFDYIADPKRLLIGYVIVGAFFVLYIASNVINPVLLIVVALVFWAAFPWLRYKSARFFAANTTYRNLRFRFTGTLGGAYAAYLGWPMLAAITMGILVPMASFKAKEYLLGNFAFGSYRAVFNGQVGWFFKVIYILFAVGGVVVVGAFSVLIGLIVFSTGMETVEGGEGEPPVWFFAAFMAVYGLIFVFFGIWIVLSKNYCWNHLLVNPGGAEIAFESRLSVPRYLWIVFSNLVLIVLTVGLYAPFAAVRIHRYRAECLSVLGAGSLDEAVAVAASEKNAMGDSAADLFDFEFGL